MTISPIIEQLERPFVFADVGARWGVHDSWRAISPPVQIVAFEADENECQRLTEAEDGLVRYEPVALGAETGPATLHVTRDPGSSSLYPPDEALIDAHPVLQVHSLVSTRTIQLQTLDEWCERERLDVDAIKLDVQGAELDVLRGAKRQLHHVVMIETEVELNPLYVDQPLFADVDRFLRARGFVLWRLTHLVHYGRDRLDSTAPIADAQAFDSRAVAVEAQGGQIFWAHAYYLAGDVLLHRVADRARRAAIAAEAFGFPDLASLLAGRR
jgi:FkbM family methyltransferase